MILVAFVLSAGIFFFKIRDLENDLSYFVSMIDSLLDEVIQAIIQRSMLRVSSLKFIPTFMSFRLSHEKAEA